MPTQHERVSTLYLMRFRSSLRKSDTCEKELYCNERLELEITAKIILILIPNIFKIKLNALWVDLHPPHDMCLLLTLHIRSAFKPSGPSARAYPGFSSIKRLGLFLLPPGWDASSSLGYHPAFKYSGTHLYNWVERERSCESKVDQGLNPDRSIRSSAHLPLGHRASHFIQSGLQHARFHDARALSNGL